MAAQFLRRHIKALTLTATAVASVGVTATTAFAQDCFVVNRSAQGAVSAGNSSQWATVDVNAVLTGEMGACPAQVQAVDAALTAAGLPLVFATRTDTVLPDNGHGIMHIDDTYLPIIGQVLSTTSC